MDVDKGITRILPPINKEQKEVKKDIERSNILQVELHKDGTLTIDDKPIKTNELRGRVREFVSTADREQYVIAVRKDIARGTVPTILRRTKRDTRRLQGTA